MNLLKLNLNSFAMSIKEKKFTIKYFDESIQDMLILQKMYDEKI